MEKKLTELSNDDLKKNLKSTKTLIGVFIGFLFAMIMIAGFDYIRNKRLNPVLISALGMVFFAAYFYKKAKNINSEINSREENK